MDEPKNIRESKLVRELKKFFKGLRHNFKQNIVDKFEDIDFKDLNNTYKENSFFRKALAAFMILVIIGLGYTGYKVNEIRTRAFDIYLGDMHLGSIRTEEEALEIFNHIQEKLSKKYNADMVLDSELVFEPTHAKDDDLVSRDDLREKIESNIGFLVSAYALTIDGEEVGVFKTKEEIDALLERVKEPYISQFTDEDKPVEINILEDVKTIEKLVPMTALSDEDKVLEYIRNGTEEIKTHTVEVGESFWTIAKMYDTSVDELVLANQDKDPQKLKPGDEVKLLLPKSLITVETIHKVEYTEAINYETKVELSDSMYKNQQRVKIEGIKGERKVVANEVRHNGIVVEKEVLEENVLKDPVDQVIVKGTKEVPRHAATRAFMMPTRGRISSRYGMRWGRMHKGLDIAASYGTPIKAADGGTVTFAGYKGSYGYMVEIDHGNGYKTRYAHCSKLLVKKGQKVAKGQHIANVGNTGRSTGAHLHFEVLKNGVHQNPSNYVR